MQNKILPLLFAILYGLSLNAQNIIKHTGTWQVENFGNGEQGTFSLVVFENEQCNANLVTASNSFYSNACNVGKANMSDAKGTTYVLDFSVRNNFDVELKLKSANGTMEYSSQKLKATVSTTQTKAPQVPNQALKEKELIAEQVETKAPAVKDAKPEETKVEKLDDKPAKPEKPAKVKEEKVKPPKAPKVEETPSEIKETKVKEEKPKVKEVAAKETVQKSDSKISSSSDRKLLYEPEIEPSCEKEYGTVVFDVTLSTTGRVIASKINLAQSNNPSSCLVSKTIELLQQMRWESISANYEEDLEVYFDYEKEGKKKKKKN